MNQVKTLFLLALLTVFLVVLGDWVGGTQGMTFALILAGVLNFVSYWWSDKIVLTLYGARPVSEAEAPELYAIVRELAQRAGIPMPRVYIVPTDHPNAFATGRSPSHAAVAVTAGILKLLSPRELRGVLAHEIAHIKNYDMLIGTVAAVLAGAITYLAYMLRWVAFFGGGRDDDRGNPLAFLVISIVAPIAALLVRLAVSRAREFEADRTGALISRDPLALASALQKISAYARRIPLPATNPATSHLFIVNPLRGQGLESLFATHPPVEERVRRLQEMARQMGVTA